MRAPVPKEFFGATAMVVVPGFTANDTETTFPEVMVIVPVVAPVNVITYPVAAFTEWSV